ncbi:MAG: hypothetical protein HY244_11640 [Rhizobiales bacterium]|nr:hypothetical protein [Hyphomicrobiales bacterium]
MTYITGNAGDARREVKELMGRVAAEARHRGCLDALRLLRDVALEGYNPDEMKGLLIETTNENVLVFESEGVRLAFDVPGNGRASTPDIALLAAEFCDFDRVARATTRPMFIARAVERRRTGERAIWPLVKPL